MLAFIAQTKFHQVENIIIIFDCIKANLRPFTLSISLTFHAVCALEVFEKKALFQQDLIAGK